MTENKTELLPCPFFSGEAEIDSMRSNRSLSGNFINCAAVYCLSCTADMAAWHSDFPDWKIEEISSFIIEKWNVRATLMPSNKAALEMFNSAEQRDCKIINGIVYDVFHFTDFEAKTIRATLQQPDDSELIKDLEDIIAESDRKTNAYDRAKKLIAKHKAKVQG